MNCHYCNYNKHVIRTGYKPYNICDITHYINSNELCLKYGIEKENDIKNKDMCYNCIHWLGAGDYNLFCSINGSICSTNGFLGPCDDFKRK